MWCEINEVRNLSLWRRHFVLSQYFETSLLELELCLVWAKPPERGIQAVESGSCYLKLCVCSPFWICSGLLRASFSSVLRRELTLSAVLCFLLQVLCSVFMDFIYIHLLCKMISAECLSLRGYVVGCLQAVSIAHIDWIFPSLNYNANIPYHRKENVSDVLQVFSSTMIHFCPIYLHFVHALGNRCFRYSHQAFNMSELGTENQLLFGRSFSTGFGIIPASCLWGSNETFILEALLRLFQL